MREQLTDSPGAIAGATGRPSKHWPPGLLGIGLIVALYAAFRGFLRKRRDAVEKP